MRAILQTLGALCLLPMAIVPTAILGCVSGILTIDEAAGMFAFYVGHAPIIAPILLCGAVMSIGASLMTGE